MTMVATDATGALAVKDESRRPRVFKYIVDGSALETLGAGAAWLQNSSQKLRRGLRYRRQKNLDCKGVDKLARWGSSVKGIDEGDGWLRVDDNFIPMTIEGVPVLILQGCGESGKSSQTEDEKTDDGVQQHMTFFLNGPMQSAGSKLHPEACTACSFYCYSKRGCMKGADCSFCHLEHTRKLRSHRGRTSKMKGGKSVAVEDRGSTFKPMQAAAVAGSSTSSGMGGSLCSTEQPSGSSRGPSLSDSSPSSPNSSCEEGGGLLAPKDRQRVGLDRLQAHAPGALRRSQGYGVASRLDAESVKPMPQPQLTCDRLMQATAEQPAAELGHLQAEFSSLKMRVENTLQQQAECTQPGFDSVTLQREVQMLQYELNAKQQELEMLVRHASATGGPSASAGVPPAVRHYEFAAACEQDAHTAIASAQLQVQAAVEATARAIALSEMDAFVAQMRPPSSNVNGMTTVEALASQLMSATALAAASASADWRRQPVTRPLNAAQAQAPGYVPGAALLRAADPDLSAAFN
eukprot:TRINITY_DN44481_c0_g1_i1.p1 TRINITY_DN44481_c0_g1~~TRINITY_DN44481_c0_g1_i1.p1  ORF type:complete len:520 (-),score=115.25 TRINITY_DN44481_c0_g1_i1:493-2052(-)